MYFVTLSLTILILGLRFRPWNSLPSHSSAFPSKVGLSRKDPTKLPITGKSFIVTLIPQTSRLFYL